MQWPNWKYTFLGAVVRRNGCYSNFEYGRTLNLSWICILIWYTQFEALILVLAIIHWVLFFFSHWLVFLYSIAVVVIAVSSTLLYFITTAQNHIQRLKLTSVLTAVLKYTCSTTDSRYLWLQRCRRRTHKNSGVRMGPGLILAVVRFLQTKFLDTFDDGLGVVKSAAWCRCDAIYISKGQHWRII